jgi:hypothetical protein
MLSANRRLPASSKVYALFGAVGAEVPKDSRPGPPARPPNGRTRLPGPLSARAMYAPLSCSPFQVAGTRTRSSRGERFKWPRLSRAGGTIIKTTVDHALMRGLATAGPVMRRGASSV